jgi:hypothetical protein
MTLHQNIPNPKCEACSTYCDNDFIGVGVIAPNIFCAECWEQNTKHMRFEWWLTTERCSAFCSTKDCKGAPSYVIYRTVKSSTDFRIAFCKACYSYDIGIRL